MSAPLQILDSFLLNYNVGQVLFLAFVLSILGTIPLKSRRVIAANCLVFGLVFIVTPISLSSIAFKFLGVVLVLVGPLLYTTAGS